MKISGKFLRYSYLRYVWCSFILFISLLAGSASAQSIDQIADRLAIAEQIARYSYTADAKDLEGFIALFTEDAVWMSIGPGQTEANLKLESRGAIRAFSAELYERNAGVRTGHHQSGLLFTELTVDRAKTRNMILVTQQGADDDAPRIAASGVYYDTWRKTAKGWLIETRTLRMETLPVTGGDLTIQLMGQSILSRSALLKKDTKRVM